MKPCKLELSPQGRNQFWVKKIIIPHLIAGDPLYRIDYRKLKDFVKVIF